MNLFLAIVVMAMVARECSSSGFDSLTNGELENFEASKQINSNREADHSSATTAQVIPDLKHYISALNQQSVLADLAALPVTDKTNMNLAFEQMVKIFGSKHPASMILSHIQWLLTNSPQLQHSFDRHVESSHNDKEKSETELQDRGLGFDLTTSDDEKQLEENHPMIREKQPKPKKSVSMKNKRENPMVHQHSLSIKESKQQRINSMTV